MNATSDLRRIQFDYDPTSVQDGRTKLTRSRESLGVLKTASNLVGELNRYLNAQCLEAEKKVDVMALRVGFSSLPDEILSDIPVLATRPNHVRLPPGIDADVVTEARS